MNSTKGYDHQGLEFGYDPVSRTGCILTPHTDLLKKIGFKKGDRVLEINNKEVRQFRECVAAYFEAFDVNRQDLQIKIERNGMSEIIPVQRAALAN
ncbi:hypothetical protein A4G20_04805 [Pasteurellaceae bacterium RH1A]|nr:hypothetical protein A4G20_04805 [Pasteurellaceae bacterium RH1A]